MWNTLVGYITTLLQKKKWYLAYLGLFLLVCLGLLLWYRWKQKEEGQASVWRRRRMDSNMPVQGRSIALYGLWNRSPLLPEHLLRSADVWERHRSLGLWYATHLVWLPDRQGNSQHWLTATEILDAFNILLKRLNELEAANRQDPPTGTTPPCLVYRIFVLEEVKAQKLHLYRFHPFWQGKQMKQAEFDVQEAFVEELQRQFGLVGEDPQTGWAANRFTHFDRYNRRKGWLVVHPQCALVAGVGATEARTLASLIHRRDIDCVGKQKGILADRYEDALGRIATWNSTQDIAETVSQLEDLVESGKRTVDGQFFISIALATIGVLLALFAYPHLNPWQVAGSILLAGATGAFWLHTRYKTRFWIWSGLLLILAALVAVFASASVLSWYQSFLQFIQAHF
jgi:hypothetical protein